MSKLMWVCHGCSATNEAKYDVCVVCGYPKSAQPLSEQISSLPLETVSEPKSPAGDSQMWSSVLLLSLPTAIFLQFLMFFLAPVVWALVLAPSEGIICKASFHGSRAVPCGLEQLIIEWWQFVPIVNLMLFGIPMLVSLFISLILLVMFFSAQDILKK